MPHLTNNTGAAITLVTNHVLGPGQTVEIDDQAHHANRPWIDGAVQRGEITLEHRPPNDDPA